ncbi:hypothetical protein DFH06DRAFT_1343624 [Mycena polygramma]|nr:hypothetical protein DFH06DRAFT_1343624 [Mycena polygramma]
MLYSARDLVHDNELVHPALGADNTIVDSMSAPWMPSHAGMTRAGTGTSSTTALFAGVARQAVAHAPRPRRNSFVFGLSAKPAPALEELNHAQVYNSRVTVTTISPADPSRGVCGSGDRRRPYAEGRAADLGLWLECEVDATPAITVNLAPKLIEAALLRALAQLKAFKAPLYDTVRCKSVLIAVPFAAPRGFGHDGETPTPPPSPQATSLATAPSPCTSTAGCARARVSPRIPQDTRLELPDAQGAPRAPAGRPPARKQHSPVATLAASQADLYVELHLAVTFGLCTPPARPVRQLAVVPARDDEVLGAFQETAPAPVVDPTAANRRSTRCHTSTAADNGFVSIFETVDATSCCAAWSSRGVANDPGTVSSEVASTSEERSPSSPPRRAYKGIFPLVVDYAKPSFNAISGRRRQLRAPPATTTSICSPPRTRSCVYLHLHAGRRDEALPTAREQQPAVFPVLCPTMGIMLAEAYAVQVAGLRRVAAHTKGVHFPRLRVASRASSTFVGKAILLETHGCPYCETALAAPIADVDAVVLQLVSVVSSVGIATVHRYRLDDGALPIELVAGLRMHFPEHISSPTPLSFCVTVARYLPGCGCDGTVVTQSTLPWHGATCLPASLLHALKSEYGLDLPGDFLTKRDTPRDLSVHLGPYMRSQGRERVLGRAPPQFLLSPQFAVASWSLRLESSSNARKRAGARPCPHDRLSFLDRVIRMPSTGVFVIALADMATAYVDAALVQECSLGWSFGGVAAYDTALQLASRGIQVKGILLSLFEPTQPHQSHPSLMDTVIDLDPPPAGPNSALVKKQFSVNASRRTFAHCAVKVLDIPGNRSIRPNCVLLTGAAAKAEIV